jgi:hypothetical protein
MGASTTPTLTNPLQVTPTAFTLGQENAFTATGADFNAGNILGVSISSTTVSWTNTSFAVKNSTTLTLTGTPGGGSVAPIGNLTITINPGPKQSSASCNNISYS